MNEPLDDLREQIETKSARVGIIGLGYVGLPLAVTASQAGFPVTGFDIDATKVGKIAAAHSYIDAVPSEALADVTARGRLSATADFGELTLCKVIVICVPTPLDNQRTPDLSFVTDTARTVARHIRPGTLVVLESTTWPGTTEEVLVPLLAESGLLPGRDIFLAFSPEREDPGNTAFSTRSIPKIVAGSGTAAGDLAQTFYGRVVDRVVRVPDTRTAEAVKITENIFRAVNIALVNELKLVYDAMGIDIWEVIDAAATKPFGFMPFYPGPGLGGHCIPIDPFYLAWKAREYEVPTRFIELAGEINTGMPHHVIDRLRAAVDRDSGRGLRGAEILLVGVAYKKNVADMRESPAMKLMQLLDEAGARVVYLDPHVPDIPPMRDYGQYRGRTSADATTLAPGQFAAVLIATDHDAIDYSALTRLDCPIVDTRNAIARRGLPTDRVTKA